MREFAKAVLLIAGLILPATGAEADFTGDQFSQAYYYPDASTVYGPYAATNATFTAPFSGELGVVEDVTTLNGIMTADTLTIDFDTTLNNPVWGNAAFNGLILTLQGPSTLNIAGVIILPGTNMVGFDASRVDFSSTMISLNWAGLAYDCDTTVKVKFTFAPPTRTPEPATIALLGAGLFGMGWGAKRRRA